MRLALASQARGPGLRGVTRLSWAPSGIGPDAACHRSSSAAKARAYPLVLFGGSSSDRSQSLNLVVSSARLAPSPPWKTFHLAALGYRPLSSGGWGASIDAIAASAARANPQGLSLIMPSATLALGELVNQ